MMVYSTCALEGACTPAGEGLVRGKTLRRCHDVGSGSVGLLPLLYGLQAEEELQGQGWTLSSNRCCRRPMLTCSRTLCCILNNLERRAARGVERLDCEARLRGCHVVALPALLRCVGAHTDTVACLGTSNTHCILSHMHTIQAE